MTPKTNFGQPITAVILSEVARALASYAVEGPRRFSRYPDRLLLSNEQAPTPRCRCRH